MTDNQRETFQYYFMIVWRMSYVALGIYQIDWWRNTTERYDIDTFNPGIAFIFFLLLAGLDIKTWHDNKVKNMCKRCIDAEKYLSSHQGNE